VNDPVYDAALEAVRSRLGKKSAEHCRRVAETAAGLAIIYGVDVRSAKLAGLLHDWDRELPAPELLGRALEAGITISDADAARPKLLHARTAAASLSAAFPGIDDDVVQAVARHTIGAVDMSRLDMVIYLADMLEPARDYPGVEELRAQVGSASLSELFALGYRESMRHLVDARKRIHPETVAVWNVWVAGDAHE
jgi:predicted HD superfamily hydrolase involved in NAD metabolism